MVFKLSYGNKVNNNFNLVTMLFADNQILIARTEEIDDTSTV